MLTECQRLWSHRTRTLSLTVIAGPEDQIFLGQFLKPWSPVHGRKKARWHLDLLYVCRTNISLQNWRDRGNRSPVCWSRPSSTSLLPKARLIELSEPPPTPPSPKANSFLSSAPPGARTDIISQGKATNCFRTSIWFLLTEAQLRPGRVKWDTGTGMARKNTKVAWKMQKWVSGTGASGIAWTSSSLFVLGLVSFGCWVSSFHRGLWEEATCFLPYDSEQTGNLKQNQKHPTGNPNIAFITNKVWVGGCCY